MTVVHGKVSDMNPRLSRALGVVRRALRTQLRLQQNFVDRYHLSGRETAVAARALRWHGDELVGDQLPRGEEGHRRAGRRT